MAGVLMIEDSGVILRNDRVFDLPMESIELIPTGEGYEIVSIPLALGHLHQPDRLRAALGTDQDRALQRRLFL
jgi:hypothetical protein